MIYDLIANLLRPVAWWGRLRVEGLELVPRQGALLVVPNHDSQWDPVLAGLALRPRRRLRFLARASLWRIPGLGPLLHAMGQIPIRRGVTPPPWSTPSTRCAQARQCAYSPRAASPGASGCGRGVGWGAWLRPARACEWCSAAWRGRRTTHGSPAAHA
jgi:1-acyl-sn-glycerol-3-phosphate acyltransferase